MKVSDILEGSKYEEIHADAQEKARHFHAIESIVNSYKTGHIHYALALKQLCGHELSVEQAKQRLSNP
jgi:hypothetical protein